MKINIKILAILIFLLSISSSFSQEQEESYVRYKLNGYAGEKAYIASIYGSRHITLDSAFSDNSDFIFKYDEMLKPGMYQIFFNDSVYTDLIVNNENVFVETHVSNLIGNMIVYQSNENKVLFDYWKYVFMVKDTVNRLSILGNRLLKESNGKRTKELDELQQKVNYFNNSIMIFANNLAVENKGSFVATLLSAYQMPDFYLYKRNPEAKQYENMKEFYKDDFFNNFNFNDTRLLRSEVIYIAINDYMRNFTTNATTSEYVEVLDFILSKVAVNPEVYKYAVELFVSNFEYSVWEKVYVHLIDNHYRKITNPDPVIAASHYKKVNSIKNLEPGKPAPKLKLYNTSLEEVDFYNIEAKVKLLFIWGSGCENCEAILPDIKEVYELYDSLGFEVISIAVTNDKRIWKKAISTQNVNWTNLSDLKGAESELADKYNVWLTPSMFLLDSNNIIISRPKFKSEIYVKLIELLN